MLLVYSQAREKSSSPTTHQKGADVVVYFDLKPNYQSMFRHVKCKKLKCEVLSA